ncbi:hypothetical protein [Mycolicibacterium fortuitum]
MNKTALTVAGAVTVAAAAPTLSGVEARCIGWSQVVDLGSAVALMRDLHISYPSFTDADDVAAALAAPPLLPLNYFVDTDGSVQRLHDVTVFRDVAQIQKSVATAHQGKTQP